MAPDLTVIQGSLGLADVPEEPSVIKRRRALPIKQCQLCKRDIVMPFLQGTSEARRTKSGIVSSSGRQLKLDPEPVVGGEFFLIGKIAHRRRDEDRHPSLLFYNEHECIAETK